MPETHVFVVLKYVCMNISSVPSHYTMHIKGDRWIYVNEMQKLGEGGITFASNSTPITTIRSSMIAVPAAMSLMSFISPSNINAPCSYKIMFYLLFAFLSETFLFSGKSQVSLPLLYLHQVSNSFRESNDVHSCSHCIREGENQSDTAAEFRSHGSTD